MNLCDATSLKKNKNIYIKRPNPSEPLPCQCLSSEERLLPQILSDMAKNRPNHMAIESSAENLTYNNLNQLVTKFAALLLQEGLTAKQAVFIYADRTPLLIIAVLTVLKAGASFTLLDPSDPVDYLHDCINAVNPSTWINLDDNVSREKNDILQLDGLIEQQFRIKLNLSSVADIENLLKSNEARSRIDFPIISGDDTATITFTSGSSGKPKAVMGRYSSLSHFQKWMHVEFSMDHHDRFAMCSNLSHDPIQRDIFTAICLGGTIVVPDYQDIFTPGQLPQWVRDKQVSVCCLTPPMCEFLTTYNLAKVKLDCLRKVFFVGASLLKKQTEFLQEVAPNADIINLYGSTETQRAVSYFNVSQNKDGLPEIIPIGQGMKDVDIMVINQSTGKLCDSEEVGEIWVRSPYIAKGYLNAPDKHVFFSNPFTTINQDFIYKTGDLGVYTTKFGVQCLGRIDNQIKIDGHRVEPSHIDNMLMRYKRVNKAVTIATLNNKGKYTLITFLVPSASVGSFDENHLKEEVKVFLAEHLPKYMLPKGVILIDRVPLTKNGKVDYKFLEKQVADFFKQNVAINTNVITTEKLSVMVAEISDMSICLAHINLPLDKLGFTSLNYMELVSSVKKEYNLTLPICAKMLSISEIIDKLLQKRHEKPVGFSTGKNEDIYGSKLLGDKRVTLISPTQIEIEGKKLLHFCSNSYLGFGQHALVRKTLLEHYKDGRSINSHGAMALNGRTIFHAQLLDEIKQLYHCDKVLLFSSAYMANISIIPALVGVGDHVFIDNSSHKSIIDGCVLAQAHFHNFKHNDMAHLEQKLSKLKNESGKRVIITEGLFSMEGDIVDLPKIRGLADKYHALLVIDEACSLGQLGFDGAGIESHFNMPGAIDFRIGTLSKAIPSVGGYVATTGSLLRGLNLRGGSIFSGAIPPIQARIAAQAFNILRNENSFIEKLRYNSLLWRHGLKKIGLNLMPGESAITAIKTRDDQETNFLYELFYQAGVYVFPALFPWNSKGKSLIRTSVTAMHTSEQIEEALGKIGGLLIKN